MLKFSDTSLWDFGVEPTTIISSQLSLTKRASEDSIVHNYKKTKGQTDLHIIALGAYEGTGFNRNLDCFLEKWCEKNAHYFTDADRAVNRHHRNKPEDPKYGNIKAAAYNRRMKRIELVLGLDDDKCSDILHEQEKVGHTNWSMASKQAHDVCTWCRHKAYTDSDRCEHIPAKLGEMNKLGEVCGMENPDPHWFEISYVRRPADRIGMSLGKVASDKLRPLLPSDYLQIYTGFIPPKDELIISKTAATKRELLGKLAELEKHVAAIAKQNPTLLLLGNTEKLAEATIEHLRSLRPAAVLKQAADAGIIFSPENFFHYVFGSKVKEAQVIAAKGYLPSIFETLQKEAGDCLNSTSYDVDVNFWSKDSALSKLASTHSLFAEYVTPRTYGSTTNLKIASVIEDTSPLTQELAKQYASYKLAALAYLEDCGKLNDQLMLVSVVQNQIS